MKSRLGFIPLVFLSWLGGVHADGMVVDKVYHPYVLPLEREIEWRIVSEKNDKGHRLMHRVGLGHSLSERVSLEVYGIGERDGEGDFSLKAYEIETRWMLTEQGEYWADWGMLFEIERDKRDKNWEASISVLSEKEFAKTSLTVNLSTIFEWGETVDEEWETELRAKYRYRWIPEFQPAIEVYAGEDFLGVGPAVMGIRRFNGQKQLKWEAGLIREVNHAESDITVRVAMEYEF